MVDPSAYVHPSADLIGDVIIGPRCYIGPGASLRGDFGRIEMRDGSNVQDHCTLHSFPGHNCLVEEDGHVGHGAILHGCIVKQNALIGMNSVVMDGVVVGKNAFVGAMSFIKTGLSVPAGSLVAGSPARVVRLLKQSEIEWKRNGTQQYQALAARCLADLLECAPLSAPEAGRSRAAAGYDTLDGTRSAVDAQAGPDGRNPASERR